MLSRGLAVFAVTAQRDHTLRENLLIAFIA